MLAIPKILLVDDDPIIHTIVENCLGPLIELHGAESKKTAFQLVEKHVYEIIIIDLHLEDAHGLSLVKELKEIPNSKNSILAIITADEGIQEEIEGHKLGIHEYLKKPVNPTLLKTIIEKNIKRQYDSAEETIKKGDLVIDLRRVSVQNKGTLVELTQKEFKLLLKLVQNEGRVLSREQLMQSAWSDQTESLERSVDMHISTLRKKLDSSGEFIKTVRSTGYVFEMS
jgi:DNA-binding response OmpR family regulator